MSFFHLSNVDQDLPFFIFCSITLLYYDVGNKAIFYKILYTALIKNIKTLSARLFECAALIEALKG